MGMRPDVSNLLLLCRVNLHIFILVVLANHQPIVHFHAGPNKQRAELLDFLEDVGCGDAITHGDDGALVVPTERT